MVTTHYWVFSFLQEACTSTPIHTHPTSSNLIHTHPTSSNHSPINHQALQQRTATGEEAEPPAAPKPTKQEARKPKAAPKAAPIKPVVKVRAKGAVSGAAEPESKRARKEEEQGGLAALMGAYGRGSDDDAA